MNEKTIRWIPYLALAAAISYAYWPSLGHMPRADHLPFVLFLKHYQGWLDSALAA